MYENQETPSDWTHEMRISETKCIKTDTITSFLIPELKLVLPA